CGLLARNPHVTSLPRAKKICFRHAYYRQQYKPEIIGNTWTPTTATLQWGRDQLIAKMNFVTQKTRSPNSRGAESRVAPGSETDGRPSRARARPWRAARNRRQRRQDLLQRQRRTAEARLMIKAEQGIEANRITRDSEILGH